ncbi:MAG: xanthine dehydrogenase family protein molybdopterin-binding subunit [Myxococcota bacterium]
MNHAVLGKAIERSDGRGKVSGAVEYAADVPVANVAHAVIVTSSVARGRVEAIDTSIAQRAPGVLAVITHANSPKLPGATRRKEPNDRILQLLQDAELLYNDQPIAVVVADTSERAREAGELLQIKYTTASVNVDLAASTWDAYTPRTAGPRAKPDSSRGDVEQALANAAVKVEGTYKTPAQNHNPMETHAVTASWQGKDALTLYDTTQGIFGVRKKIAALFGLDTSAVRVISHYVGGGFGCKGTPWSHVVLCAMAARVAGRPVRLVLTRQQMFSLVGHRPETIQHVVLAASRDGKLLAMKHDVVSSTSRFDEFSEPSALQTRMLYACPNVATSHRLVRLDTPAPTFMRAPGEASGTFALEVALDELAGELRLDPLELRLRNYAERDPEEDKPWSSKSLRECYRRAAERFGWARRKPEPRSMRDGNWLVGWGMATATYPARQSGASARVKIKRDGSVVVQAGSQDLGTGTYTIFSQIAADVLGVPLERVRCEIGDTALPETPVSGGSQTASSTGSAVKLAALELKQKLIELALNDRESPLFSAARDSIEVADAGLRVRGKAKQAQSYETLLARAPSDELEAEVKSAEKPERKSRSCHSFGTHFVEVKVDPYTAQIRVARCVSAFAAGKILNQKTARSQYMGGMVWGIGFALEEHTVRDPRSGRVVTRDLADYHVPVHADVPELDVILVDEIDEYVNELGCKGIGEIGITGMAGAIANAVYHATGKRVRELPITLDKLL